jgi:DNA polymerase III delta subunit
MRIRSFDSYERMIQEEDGGKRKRTVFLLAGTEHYQRNRLREAILVSLTGSSSSSDMDLVRLDAPALSKGDLSRMTSEGSLFASGRLFVISSVDRTPAAARPEVTESSVSPGDNAFLYITDETSFRTKLMKGLSEAAATYVCYPPFERDMYKWCKKIAAEERISLTADAAQSLIAHAVGDLSGLADSLTRLSLFYGEGSSIGEAEVSSVIEAGDATSLFRLLDLVMDGDTGGATKVFWGLLERGEDAVGVLSFLYSQWIKLQQVREMLDVKRMTARDISRELGIRGRMLDRLVKAARSASGRTTAGAAEAFAEADEALKTGGDPYLAAAQLVGVLTHGRA